MNRLLSALSLCVVFACDPPAPAIPGTIVTTGTPITQVNGNPITQEMLDAKLQQIPPQLREQLEQAGQMSQVTEQLVVGELLYREALLLKLHDDPQVKLGIAIAEREALAGAMLDKIAKERTTDDAVTNYYQDHLVQYGKPQAKLRIMVLPDEASATDAIAKVTGGADFGELAKTVSKDPRTAASGGDLGWMEKSKMGGAIGAAVFAANKGELVGPLETPTGWLVFQLEDKRENTPMEEVKDEVLANLDQEVRINYIKELREKATVAEPGKDGATVTAPAPGAPAKSEGE